MSRPPMASVRRAPNRVSRSGWEADVLQLGSPPAVGARMTISDKAPVVCHDLGLGSARPRVVRSSAAAPDGEDLLVDVVASVLERATAGWRMRVDDFWCHVCRSDWELPHQGWKLHVSATPLSAPHVLSRAAAVLVRGACGFKFARTVAGVGQLVSQRYPRGCAGKFITAYPDDVDHLLRLAEELDAATRVLPGPSILSDRPYRPGSLVHYRYGAFSGTRVLTNDGTYEVRLRAPDGALVSDRRDAWFSPPTWAGMPQGSTRTSEASGPSASSPRAVVLDERYVVRAAIRHANKGGVYRGVDRATGTEVVIKHARAHTGSTLAGTDARDVLRNEARMLERLAGIAPRLVATFEHAGDEFLVQEAVQGGTLRHWVTAQLDQIPECDAGLSAQVVVRRARELVELVQIAHAANLVLRDLSPNNVMVTADDAMLLIDLECVTHPGTPVARAFTDPYAAKEVVATPTYGPAPALTADLYSLGATMFYLAAGSDPALPDDDPPTRPVAQRLGWVIDCIAARNRGLQLLGPAIVGLMDDDPDRRWTLERVLNSLALAEQQTAGSTSGGACSTGVQTGFFAEGDRLLAEGLEYVLETMVDNDGRIWATGSLEAMTDPYNVQHGAAGEPVVLVRAYEALGDPRLRECIRFVADWLERGVQVIPSRLPGLYFGRSGAAWGLHEAGRALRAPDLTASALSLVRDVPVRWPNPDVCHGAAGAGLALLHLWEATADAELGDRVAQCADGLLAAAERRPEGLIWPIPTGFDSRLAGLAHLGFAHGAAGVGAFLLAAGSRLGEGRYVEAAGEAGATLARTALIARGEALWPTERGDSGDGSPGFTHWCSGASGVGTFLVRLWRAGGGEQYRRLAEFAALAAFRRRWHGSPVACHGVAGDAEFLLDMAAAGCGENYRRWAEELAACIYLRHARRNGRRVVADDTQRSVTVGYNTGLAGVLGLLLRLRYGGPRWFMPADLVLPGVPDKSDPSAPTQTPAQADCRSRG